MSGKGCKARRLHARNLAREAVYASNGAQYRENVNPFTDETQRQIFERRYDIWLAKFNEMESRLRELELVYGT